MGAMRFIGRNPGFVCRNPRQAWATIKAMRAYAKEHPTCEWDGRSTDVEVHHIFPIHKFPRWADNPNNFISLSRRAHFVIGHYGDWRAFNPDVRQVINRFSRPQKQGDA